MSSIKKSSDLDLTVTHDTTTDEHRVRVEKVAQMRAEGQDPWPHNKQIPDTCHAVIQEFVDGDESKQYTVAGRMILRREHGKTAFALIKDRTGTLQLYLKKDVLGDVVFDQFLHKYDVGDSIAAEGTSFKTKTGEITLKVDSLELLSKCLYPLPEKFHGLVDIETRYRQRYLDLISNEESAQRFRVRSKIVHIIRTFFADHDFMEVETPMLHPIPGGAAARPFVTHHNSLGDDFYLRIAPELYLKRLVIGGFERVYEIGRCFRNEGISTRHNPEFTMVEFYAAYQDYISMMNFVEKMLKKVVSSLHTTTSVEFDGKIIDFGKPFVRMSMHDAICLYGKLDPAVLRPEQIDAVLQQHGITVKPGHTEWGHKLVVLFDELVEPHLLQPTFITDYPIVVSPLSKQDPHNKEFAPRFELFIGGMEVSNGFNELNDPFDQADRFKKQVEEHEAGDDEAHHYDADYIQALEYGLPPTAGAGIGIDRLTMLLTNTTSIKDVILFPTLKKK